MLERQVAAEVRRGVEVDGGAVGLRGVAGVVGDVEHRRDGAVEQPAEVDAVMAVAQRQRVDHHRAAAAAAAEGDGGGGEVAVEPGQGEAHRALLGGVGDQVGGIDAQRQVAAEVRRGVEVDGGAVGLRGVAGVVGDVEHRRDGAVEQPAEVDAVMAVAQRQRVDHHRAAAAAAAEGDGGGGEVAVKPGQGEAHRALLGGVGDQVGGIDVERQVAAEVRRGVEVDGGAVGLRGVAGVVGDVEHRRDGAVEQPAEVDAVMAVAQRQRVDHHRAAAAAAAEGDGGGDQVAVEPGQGEAHRALLGGVGDQVGGIDAQRQVAAEVRRGVQREAECGRCSEIASNVDLTDPDIVQSLHSSEGIGPVDAVD